MMHKVNTREVNEEQGHCGLIRKLSVEGPARIVHLVVKNAERHFHKRATEYYYVLGGYGQLYLNDELIDIKQGDLVEIEPGVVHQAIEGRDALEILVIEVPPTINDVHISRG